VWFQPQQQWPKRKRRQLQFVMMGTKLEQLKKTSDASLIEKDC